MVCRSVDKECVKSPSYGSTSGFYYEDNEGFPCDANIIGINIRHGDIVNGIQMLYLTSTNELILGKWGGENVDKGELTVIKLGYGEMLRGITGVACTNLFGTYIIDLAFIAETADRDSTVYGPYGRPDTGNEKSSCGLFVIAGNIKSVFGRTVMPVVNGTGLLGALGAHILR